MLKGMTEKAVRERHGEGMWDATCSFSCPECRRNIFVDAWDMIEVKTVDVKCPHCETLFNKKWR